MEVAPALGRVQDVNGETYYSPNSLIDAHLELELKSDDLTNPFKPGSARESSIRYKDLVHPRPWSMAFGWIAFIPVNPWYLSRPGPFLSVLSTLPPVLHFSDNRRSSHGYRIPNANDWITLERELYDAVTALRGKYHLPCVLPFLPNAVGYNEMYSSKKVLKSQVLKAREWFLVWLAALSFLIAAAKAPFDPTERKGKGYPEWRSVLESSGLKPSWIDDLLSSPVCDPRPENRRVGCILNLLNPVPGQPSLQWFIDNGIPVWYRWGPKEKAAAVDDKYVASFRPLNARGREGEFDSQMLAPLPPPNSELPKAPAPRPEPTWVAFFREREEKHKKILEKETPVARQRRENRLRDPPTTSAPVFEWWPSESDPSKYERVPVSAKWRADTLTSYGTKQTRYDPFYNEWDCCDQFGDDDPDSDEDDDDIRPPTNPEAVAPSTDLDMQLPVVGPEPASPNADRETIPPINNSEPPVLDINPEPLPPVLEATLTQTETHSLPPPVSYQETDRPSELFIDAETYSRMTCDLSLQAEEVFRPYYGYRLPLPGAAIPVYERTARGKDLIIRLLGYGGAIDPESHWFTTDHYNSVQHFFNSLSTRQPTWPGTWDLRNDCPTPVQLSPRFKTIRKIPLPHASKTDQYDQIAQYFVFDDPDPVHPWKFGVPLAASALLACRLSQSCTNEDLAFYFAQRGIGFRTFFPFTSPQRPLRAPLLLEIPQRKFDHLFSKQDYDSYIHQRTILLGRSHMQAALKRGGIVWRLALSTLGLSNVTQPPSHSNAVHTICLPGEEYTDDALTTIEMDLICGVYECVSSDGKQRALKSWWPSARYYEKDECGENYGYWNGRREAWYSKRLRDIEKGESCPQPMTYTAWKSSQHGPSPIRQFHSHIERSSAQLLDGTL